jgi:ankyrin repeat protein
MNVESTMSVVKKGVMVWLLLLVLAHPVAGSEIADFASRNNLDEVSALIASGVDVNEPQVDGATALHWAVRWDNIVMARELLEAGADPNVINRAGAAPMLLASVSGSADMISMLLEAGASANQALTITGDTPLMIAARTGISEAVRVLLDAGADVQAQETWGGGTALMSAVAAGHSAVAEMLISASADVNARTYLIPRNTGRGLQFEGLPPRKRLPGETGPQMHASGEFTPLLLAAREGFTDTARLLIDSGADIDARAADGKDALSLAIYNGNFGTASFLVARGANVNQVDARGFTPLFWAVDRRNMETAPNFPWTVTDDPLPLVREMLEAGADPNTIINETPQALMREGSPRLVFGTALMRAAFSGDPDLVRLLLEYGADPFIRSSDDETALGAAAGTGFIYGFHKERPLSERLEVIKILVEAGLDVNWHDDYGITPLMAAANLGDVEIIQYLVDQGADLGAFDLGEKNDGVFGASIEPLMPIDYAIGVGTFRPNNAIVFNTEAVALMERLMEEKGIEHITSECTLRGFTCSTVNMDPKFATPADIARARSFQTGYQVDDISKGTGLEVGASDIEPPAN